MRSLGNANYWHKVTQGFPPECLNCPTPGHCRSEPEGTAGYCRTAVEGPAARTVAFNLAIRKSSVLSRRLTGHPLRQKSPQYLVFIMFISRLWRLRTIERTNHRYGNGFLYRLYDCDLRPLGLSGIKTPEPRNKREAIQFTDSCGPLTARDKTTDLDGPGVPRAGAVTL